MRLCGIFLWWRPDKKRKYKLEINIRRNVKKFVVFVSLEKIGLLEQNESIDYN
jgi:hypothetical protein